MFELFDKLTTGIHVNMHRTLFFLILSSSFLLLSLPTCKKSTEPPPPNGGPDTTSHNFTWQIDTLGDGSSSVLYDVAIIDENNIWAVGEIYLKDSTGQFNDPAYNAAKWDGTKWNLIRVLVRDWGGGSGYYPLTTVFGFSPNDVWFASYADLIQWNGSSFMGKAFFMTSIPFDGQVIKMWGSSGSNIYCVGRNGAIYHYNGTTWQKLESGTNVDLEDLWGTPNGSEVWTCGLKFDNSESILLRKQDSGWETLWQLSQFTPPNVYAGELLGSLWTDGKEYFVTGSGDIFRHSIANTEEVRREPVNLGNYAYRIRGDANNDVMLVGDAAMVWHWNGSTWHRYDELRSEDDRLYGLAVSPSMIVAVGRRYTGISSSALIILGRR